mmetsp:Transcript_14125/g.23089  ORF Transcript_14125/g.23089 Transcript_14125/m.23089 type:complete len:222 (+) Transcript_14125:1697-2362(+)
MSVCPTTEDGQEFLSHQFKAASSSSCFVSSRFDSTFCLRLSNVADIISVITTFGLAVYLCATIPGRPQPAPSSTTVFPANVSFKEIIQCDNIKDAAHKNAPVVFKSSLGSVSASRNPISLIDTFIPSPNSSSLVIVCSSFFPAACASSSRWRSLFSPSFATDPSLLILSKLLCSTTSFNISALSKSCANVTELFPSEFFSNTFAFEVGVASNNLTVSICLF